MRTWQRTSDGLSLRISRTEPIPIPYTFRDIDAAISHLEIVLDTKGASSLFSPAYWRERVLRASATKGLDPKQQQRLHRLLERIKTF